MTILIQGFGDDDKVPGAVSQVTYGVGAASVGSAALFMLLVALPTQGGSGTAVADTEVFSVTSPADAAVKTGQGSEFYVAALKALKRKVQLYGIVPAISSPTQATITLTVNGTWTAAGSWAIRIDGVTISAGITANNLKADVAALITSTVNGNADLPVTAAQGTSSSTNVVTFTWKSGGVRGNRSILWIDPTALPAGCTMAASGGATATGGGVYFSGGAATEDVTNVLNVIGRKWYNYIAPAQSDATNVARWRAFADAQAAPLTEKPSFLVFAMNDTLTNTASIVVNNMNDPLLQMVWQLNGESHPTEVAAAMCALRCESEQTNANADYDDAELVGVQPTDDKAAADIPNRPTMQIALDEGVTPLYTTSDARVRVVRSITTLSMQNAAPYYGVLDTSEAVVPQEVRRRLKVRWGAFRQANPYLRGEPAPSEPTPPQGVATPSRWNAQVANELLLAENGSLLTQTALNPPRTEYDSVSNRFMTEAPTYVLKHQHQVGISVLQLTASGAASS